MEHNAKLQECPWLWIIGIRNLARDHLAGNRENISILYQIFRSMVEHVHFCLGKWVLFAHSVLSPQIVHR